VREETGEDLLQAWWIDIDPARRRVHLDDVRGRRVRALHQADRLPDRLGEIDGPPVERHLARLHAGGGEEIIHEALEMADLPLDHGPRLPGDADRGAGALQDLSRAGDGRDGIAEL